jgi:acetyltransferase-like isoleucine patch superfamily enzyme
MDPKSRGMLQRLRRVMLSFSDPRLFIHAFRLLHYYGYSHVLQRANLSLGQNVSIAPNVSLRNAARISLADNVQLGEYCSLWAGLESGRISIGARTTFGPGSFVTAANYSFPDDLALTEQPMIERDVVIGADCWIGAKAVILSGVTIGNGSIIGAGAVVTKNVPAGAVAVGVPARVIRRRKLGSHKPEES